MIVNIPCTPYSVQIVDTKAGGQYCVLRTRRSFPYLTLSYYGGNPAIIIIFILLRASIMEYGHEYSCRSGPVSCRAPSHSSGGVFFPFDNLLRNDIDYNRCLKCIKIHSTIRSITAGSLFFFTGKAARKNVRTICPRPIHSSVVTSSRSCAFSLTATAYS